MYPNGNFFKIVRLFIDSCSITVTDLPHIDWLAKPWRGILFASLTVRGSFSDSKPCNLKKILLSNVHKLVSYSL